LLNDILFMNNSEIAKIRLFNQQIAATKLTRPAEIVSWFGGMQAQDYPMAKWAIGVRLPGSTEREIEKAIEAGEILRTHLMRPTWHFVDAKDIRWMLNLTAPNIRSASASMFRQLELDEKVCQHSNEIIAKALAGNKHLTRVELMLELKSAGIRTDDFRATYLMLNAELGRVVCNGIKREKQQTYALLDERVSKTPELSREEAIAELTIRYFTSHAPATLKDFVWWSGLSVRDARKGLEMNKTKLVSKEIENQTFWMPDSISIPKDESNTLYLLPAFDEFTVSYKDRSASLEPEFAKQTNTGNGIFKPIIVVNGKIEGIWKRSLKKDSLIIEKTLFTELNNSENETFVLKAQQYGLYEGKNIKLI
jgi:hypothetical protein